MTPLHEWASWAQRKFGAISDRTMAEEVLMRDPIRPRRTDPLSLFAPADGVVLHNKIVMPDESIETKGTYTTVSDLFDGNPPIASCYLVCGIFMTYYDVHVNKAPVAGLFSSRELGPIKTKNLPMIFAEDALMKNLFGKALSLGNYQKYNARTIYRFCVPNKNRDVYVVALADSEVNVIAPFTTRRNAWMCQNERFGLVRWGSQVELVVPGVSLDEAGVLPVVPDRVHVEGGVDIVARWLL